MQQLTPRRFSELILEAARLHEESYQLREGYKVGLRDACRQAFKDYPRWTNYAFNMLGVTWNDTLFEATAQVSRMDNQP